MFISKDLNYYIVKKYFMCVYITFLTFFLILMFTAVEPRGIKHIIWRNTGKVHVSCKYNDKEI